MSLSKDTMVKVTNRDNGSVGYVIPDLGNLRREFAAGEHKTLSYDELKRLSYIPGGRYLLENCLLLDNKQAIQELLEEVEPEYFYTQKEVEELLNFGSLDQLDDCLTFAPTGVIELVKATAVKTKLNDLQKRKMIYDRTGFNVSKAIEINDETEKVEPVVTSTRKANPIKVTEKQEEDTPKRKATSRYNVVSVGS